MPQLCRRGILCVSVCSLTAQARAWLVRSALALGKLSRLAESLSAYDTALALSRAAGGEDAARAVLEQQRAMVLEALGDG